MDRRRVYARIRRRCKPERRKCLLRRIERLSDVVGALERGIRARRSSAVWPGADANVGGNVKGQLEADLKLEVDAVGMCNKAIRVSRENNDDASRELFARLLKDEEEHVDWLEAQLHQIKEMGYERYLSNQAEGENE